MREKWKNSNYTPGYTIQSTPTLRTPRYKYGQQLNPQQNQISDIWVN